MAHIHSEPCRRNLRADPEFLSFGPFQFRAGLFQFEKAIQSLFNIFNAPRADAATFALYRSQDFKERALARSMRPDDVEAELKAIRQAELDAMRDEWRAKLYSGEISVWSLFEDYAMLGDSRTSGFTYYGYLAPERVFADSGATIKKVIDHLEELVALNPSIIFLTYGINDVGIGYWPTPEDYVNEINNTLALLKEHLPNATVYVCSIIPALEPAFKRGPAWREIPDYNDAVRAFCEENGTPYVDITQLCEEHTDLYQDDGVHLLGGFYPLWGTELIAEVYDDVFALESNESAAE